MLYFFGVKKFKRTAFVWCCFFVSMNRFANQIILLHWKLSSHFMPHRFLCNHLPSFFFRTMVISPVVALSLQIVYFNFNEAVGKKSLLLMCADDYREWQFKRAAEGPRRREGGRKRENRRAWKMRRGAQNERTEEHVPKWVTWMDRFWKTAKCWKEKSGRLALCCAILGSLCVCVRWILLSVHLLAEYHC